MNMAKAITGVAIVNDAIIPENIEPESRIEELLMAWLGKGNTIDPPMSNNERILQNIIGIPDVEIQPIQSRVEALLLMILEKEEGTENEDQ